MVVLVVVCVFTLAHSFDLFWFLCFCACGRFVPDVVVCSRFLPVVVFVE